MDLTLRFAQFTFNLRKLEKNLEKDHIFLFESIKIALAILYIFHISKRMYAAKDKATPLLLACFDNSSSLLY